MNIIVIGKSGQVASELALLATEGLSITCLGRDDIDLLEPDSIRDKLEKLDVDAIINASAYTAVDLAETEQAGAFGLNATAVANLADYCKSRQCYFLHVSTDFVFDGQKSSPYRVEDLVNPLGVYGASKAEGENLIWKLHPELSGIVRTSWVYSTFGNNFVKTMLRLMADKQELGIVGDQIGTPTNARFLAEVLIKMAQQKLVGLFHWTDAGVASWYDFAVAIQELSVEKGLLSKSIPIHSIATKDYPTPAKRPSYSVLDKSKILAECKDVDIQHWRKQLSEMLDQLQSVQQ